MNWNKINELLSKYMQLGIYDSLDHPKTQLYSIITNSTQIEGSTLSEQDTQILFDEELTAGGKPLLFHLMNRDLKSAYEFAENEAQKKRKISTELLRELNAIVMSGTGEAINTPLGSVDVSKGDYRLFSVTAGSGSYFPNYQKLPDLMKELCVELNKGLEECKTIKEKYELSFLAHYKLVSIHPWRDGNGRTSRLLMNYIQFYFKLLPSMVLSRNKKEYIRALQESREKDIEKPILDFLSLEFLCDLEKELTNKI